MAENQISEQTAERYTLIVSVCTAIMSGGIGAQAEAQGMSMWAEMFAPVGMVAVLWGIATLIHWTLHRYYDD
jgi:hypothetical protein